MPLISSGMPLKVNFYNSVMFIYLWLRIFTMFTAYSFTLIDCCASNCLLSSNLLMTQLQASSGWGITTSFDIASSSSCSWLNVDVTYNSFSLILGAHCFLTSSILVLRPFISPRFLVPDATISFWESPYITCYCYVGSPSYSTFVKPASSASPAMSGF